MSKQKGSRYDVGRCEAYKYHVLGLNRSLKNKSVVDDWYPTSTVESELIILKKIYDLCAGQDGNPCRIDKVNELSKLYLTSEYVYDDKSSRYFKHKPIDEKNRLFSRYDSFVKNGLVLDRSIYYVGLTFDGVRRMENLITSQSKDDILHEIETLNKHVNGLSSDIMQELSVLVNNSAKKSKFRIVDGIGVFSNVCSIFSSVATAYPGLSLCLQSIRNVLSILV